MQLQTIDATIVASVTALAEQKHAQVRMSAMECVHAMLSSDSLLPTVLSHRTQDIDALFRTVATEKQPIVLEQVSDYFIILLFTVHIFYFNLLALVFVLCILIYKAAVTMKLWKSVQLKNIA